ncbi:MAG TPA: hypothetical protein VI685_14310 [Candidatus Angelobacter sp.]
MAFQNTRLLLAWMDQNEAVAQLLGHFPRTDENIAAEMERWTFARLRLSERPEYRLRTPVLSPLPPDLVARGEAFLAREDVRRSFQGWDYTVGIVDLREVLSFQKSVVVEAVDRAAGLNLNDPAVLFSLCLPDPSAMTFSGTADPDQKGISFSSPNPNLRVVSGKTAMVDGLPFYGFAVGYGLPFLQVVEYQGRWFVRDGYHRCYALLQRGVSKAPCLFLRAANVLQFGGIAPQFFISDILFGSRPPFLTDFLDDNLAATVTRPASGKVIRIVAQEFSVQL